MIPLTSLPALDDAAIVELARMFLARKLMAEDRRGTLSPMVNAPLAQCQVLASSTAEQLHDWLPRLIERFESEMADRSADPSLSRHLAQMPDPTARHNLILQYFLPFALPAKIYQHYAEHLIGAAAGLRPDTGPLYPTVPSGGKIVLPRPFLSSIYDQLLTGRHSLLHLEARRSGQTDTAASDRAITAFLQSLSGEGVSSTGTLFHQRTLPMAAFAASQAYAHMMELGFSRAELEAALSPWILTG
ncbi:hypothetical protein JMM63_19110 [Rhodovulum sulfidophilum]|uniref:hypothetical protein n=1 Tax=Rhodovulum sulfidophilum TaxID=35806 RepID=UPI00192212A5|nr:hypothetical protein [Rhodovulum sulfidophilum]MBL3597635.1 hypothetical protein [Rhodovulum sulfidophilum]